ncbi:MAG TPA: N-acetylglucosamine-6-phosphate deacetylase [Candidatus Hydrogenedentes bacterium]|nr:N-acetylglucosamine-6-phosphate deacetylase [Candidatus Hydrogenedentota bacterium]HIJ73455.1 N-acetylglucosamine-6-phosphate deacetylase [Candidatus Hydrogenedentota bacterium]
MNASRNLPDSYTGPGLVDLQVNGCAGFDFNSAPADWTADAFRRVQAALRRRGVLVALPTLITDDPERMVGRARKYAAIVQEDAQLAQTFPKLHVEGPFVSPEDGPRGAHPRAFCRAPAQVPDLWPRLRDASGGRIGVFTLAPELPGAIELIARLAEAGVLVGIGHTQASAECLEEAVSAGARIATHLGNGSHQMLPRLDNYVQAQLADDRLSASFIADGHHMPFSTLKNFLRAKTLGKSVLVSDATAAADVGPGSYTLGGEEVVVSDTLRVSKPGQSNLAGSALTLDWAVINVCERCGIDFSAAWAMASGTPATLLSMSPPRTISVTITPEGFRVGKS